MGVSQRRACHVLGHYRSTHRYRPKENRLQKKLVGRVIELAREQPRSGYRMIARRLRQEGWQLNDKRVYRIWRQEGLKVPQKRVKKRRLGNKAGGLGSLRAERPNHVWSIDFIFDRTSNGKSLKILTVIDEFTRECIALEVNRKFTSNDLVELLADLFAIRGVPEHLRSDNGPEFISQRLRRFLAQLNINGSLIEPGSPWENGFVESFHSRLRDECLACELFGSLNEARELIGRWRDYYNHRRPHGSLGGLTPAVFATRWSASASVAPLPLRKLTKPRNLTQTQYS